MKPAYPGLCLVILLLVSCSAAFESDLQVRPTPTHTPITPKISIRSSSAGYKVGDTAVITANPVGIGLPYYTLNIQEDGSHRTSLVVRLTYDNRTTVIENNSPLLGFSSASGAMSEATYRLKMKNPGVFWVWVNATGEIHGSTGTTWAGGGSEKLQLIIHR